MIVEAVVSILMLAAIVFIIWFGVFASRAADQLLPLIETLVEEKKKKLKEGNGADSRALAVLEARIAAIEREQRALREGQEFVHSLLEGDRRKDAAQERSR